MDRNQFLQQHILDNEDDVYTIALNAMGSDYKDDYTRKQSTCLALYRLIENGLKMAGYEHLVDALRQYSDFRTDMGTLLANAMFAFGADLMEQENRHKKSEKHYEKQCQS